MRDGRIYSQRQKNRVGSESHELRVPKREAKNRTESNRMNPFVISHNFFIKMLIFRYLFITSLYYTNIGIDHFGRCKNHLLYSD